MEQCPVCSGRFRGRPDGGFSSGLEMELTRLHSAQSDQPCAASNPELVLAIRYGIRQMRRHYGPTGVRSMLRWRRNSEPNSSLRSVPDLPRTG